MIAFIIRRIFRGLVALFLFVTFVFFVSQILIPHTFTVQFSMGLNRDAREEMEHELGLDLPLWQQYLNWMGGLLKGSLGTSYYGFPVMERILSVLPPTLLVFLTGTVIAFLIGQWLGKVTGWRGSGLLSGSATFSAIALYTTFPPWLSFLMIYFFVRRLELFPSLLVFYNNPLLAFVEQHSEDPNVLTFDEITLYILISVLGMLVVMFILNKFFRRSKRQRLLMILSSFVVVGVTAGSWYLFGIGPQMLSVLHFAGLPILTYVLLSFGETTLIMQTSMQDTVSEEYITTARAKGLPSYVIRDKHAARNALIPVFSRLVVSIPYLLTGIVIIERSLNWHGIGDAMLMHLYNQDMPVVMGALVLIGLVSMIARLLLEILELALDP
ncbi:MAG: ABC transporter permease, partial [Anaerolineales bacterium]